MTGPNVAEGGNRVGEEHHPETGEGEVEAGRRKIMGCRIVQHHPRMGRASSHDALARQRQLLFRDVDAQHATAWSDRLGQSEQRGAGATADIQDALASPWCSGSQSGLGYAGEEPVDPSLLGHPASCRLTVPIGLLGHPYGCGAGLFNALN